MIDKYDIPVNLGVHWLELTVKQNLHFLYQCRHYYIRTCLSPMSEAEWLSSWLAEQEDRGSIPGLATWIFRDWLSPASKSRYGWKIAKSTLILKTTNQPTDVRAV